MTIDVSTFRVRGLQTGRKNLDLASFERIIREGEKQIDDWFNDLRTKSPTLQEFESRSEKLKLVPVEMAQLRQTINDVSQGVVRVQALQRTQNLTPERLERRFWSTFLGNLARNNPDVYWLARIIIGEALGEPERSRRAVGWTVIHRIMTGDNGSFCITSIRDVIHCPGQFVAPRDPRNRRWAEFSETGVDGLDFRDGRVQGNVRGWRECLRIAYGIVARTEPDPLPDVTFFSFPDRNNWAHQQYLAFRMILLWVSPTGQLGFYDRPCWWWRENRRNWPRNPECRDDFQ